MHHELFYKFGNLIYQLRWAIICVWLALLLLCVPVAPHVISVFKSTGFSADNSASVKAENFINKKLGFSNNKFIIMYSSEKLSTNNRRFMREIKKSLAGLKDFSINHEIIYPDSNVKQISKDKHSAYAVILLKDEDPLSQAELDHFKSLIKTPPKMTMLMGGEPIFVENVNKQTQIDLFHADLIAAPVTIVMMIIIFESIIGAMIPVVVGAGCSLMVLTILYFVGTFSTLSIFTLNIALLLGLCLSLDYALFIISRFRYELRNGHSTKDAIALTQATAGKAVFFSGMAVFVSLSPLLFFPVNILFSVGVGGLSAVFVAVVTANIVLPAVLSILSKRINLLSIKILTPKRNGHSPFWHWLVTKVVKRPITYFVAIMVLLLTLSYPVIHAKFGISDYKILPPHSDSREFFDNFNASFNENALTPIQMAVKTDTDVLNRSNLLKLIRVTKQLKKNPLIDEVDSIVSTSPALSSRQYHALYTMPAGAMNEGIKTLLDTTTRKNMSIITIVSKYSVNSPESKALALELKNIKLDKGMTAQFAGITLRNVDVFNVIKEIFPYAILAVMLFTYVILLVLLRSLFLPLKAIAMTILSLSASYGVLVFIIQFGYFSELLQFQPQGMLDVSLLVIIFCALFGFSMDYEVFLLSRIKEQYDKTGDTVNSIVFGVEHSSRIITSAALIVIVICCSFMVADVLMVKAFGLGIAVAIFTDAFLIRSLLVPAIMVLMGRWNWYLPKPIDDRLPKA